MLQPLLFNAAGVRGNPGAHGLIRLLGALIATEFVLVAVYVLTQTAWSSAELSRLFNLDGEGNIPAWFSSVQLFAIALAFGVAAINPVHVEGRWSGFLLVCGGGFGVLSLDEAAGLHEQVNRVLKRVEWWPRFPSGRGFWIFAYGAAGMIGLALMWRWVKRFFREHAPDAVAMIAATGVLVGGAFVVEGVGYEIVGLDGPTKWQVAQVATEEFMEMLGASLMLAAVLRFALRQKGREREAPGLEAGQVKAAN